MGICNYSAKDLWDFKQKAGLITLWYPNKWEVRPPQKTRASSFSILRAVMENICRSFSPSKVLSKPFPHALRKKRQTWMSKSKTNCRISEGASITKTESNWSSSFLYMGSEEKRHLVGVSVSFSCYVRKPLCRSLLASFLLLCPPEVERERALLDAGIFHNSEGPFICPSVWASFPCLNECAKRWSEKKISPPRKLDQKVAFFDPFNYHYAPGTWSSLTYNSLDLNFIPSMHRESHKKELFWSVR